jgi:hypothetical protein
VVDRDAAGIWASVECEAAGCEAHVSIRPAAEDWSWGELLDTVLGWAQDDGWALAGSTLCPQHGYSLPQTGGTVGAGYDWASVVNRAQRPS